MWWMAIQAAVAYSEKDKADAAAKEEMGLRKVEARLTNETRVMANVREHAIGSLSRWVQSVNNNLALRAGGKALEANTVNARKAKDYRTERRFSSSLSEAEALGAASAAKGASGLNGSVVDMVAGTVALRSSIVNEQLRKQGISEDDASAQRAGMIMSQMVNGLDNSIIYPNRDNNVNVAQEVKSPSAISTYAPLLASAANLVSDFRFSSQDTSPLTSEQQGYFDGNSNIPNSGLGEDDPFSLWVSN